MSTDHLASELIPPVWTGTIRIWEMGRRPTTRHCVQPQSRGRKGAARQNTRVGNPAVLKLAGYFQLWGCADNLGCRAAPFRSRLCGCIVVFLRIHVSIYSR